MAKRAFVIGLVIVAALLSTLNIIAVADSSTDSLITLNRTGVADSVLIIGRQGVSDSRLVIASTIIVIELTGVHVYPISCDFGLLRPRDIRATDADFAIYNASNVTVNATIAVEGDWVGSSNWTHSDDCTPGMNTAGLRAIVEDGDGSHTVVVVRKTEPYNYLVTDLAPGGIRHFALEIYAPTEFSDYSPKRNGIFITVEGL